MCWFGDFVDIVVVVVYLVFLVGSFLIGKMLEVDGGFIFFNFDFFILDL